MPRNVPLKNGEGFKSSIHRRSRKLTLCEVLQEETGTPCTILFDQYSFRCASRQEVRDLIETLQRGLDCISDDELIHFEETERLESSLRQKSLTQNTLPFIPQSPPKKPGFLYLIVTSIGCKIGITKSIKDRVKTHLISLPISPTAIYACNVDDMPTHENVLHRHFRKKRTRGEWFALDDDDVKAIIWEYGMRLYGEEAAP